MEIHINIDGFFETSCRTCGSQCSWRISGYELPMTYDLLDAEPHPEREPRKLVSEEQRVKNLGWLAAYRREALEARPYSSHAKAPAKPGGGRGTRKTPRNPGGSQRVSTGKAREAATVPFDMDELIAERTPSPEGMSQTEIWREQAKSST